MLPQPYSSRRPAWPHQQSSHRSCPSSKTLLQHLQVALQWQHKQSQRSATMQLDRSTVRRRVASFEALMHSNTTALVAVSILSFLGSCP